MIDKHNAYELKDGWNKPIPSHLTKIVGIGFKEAVKGSNLFRSGLIGPIKKLMVIIGGREDCIDVVRGGSYVFGNLVLRSHPQSPCRSFMTIKGGIKGCHIEGVLLGGKTRWWRDIGIGDFTNYGWDTGPVTNVTLKKVFRADGKKVRVLVFHGEKPIVDDPKNFRIIKVPKSLVWVYFKILMGRNKVMALFGKKPS